MVILLLGSEGDEGYSVAPKYLPSVIYLINAPPPNK